MAYELITPINAAVGQLHGQYFIIGRVKKVVMGPFIGNTNKPDPDYTNPGDIGKIKYELLYSPLATSKANEVSEPAFPIFSFIKQYPVVNEIVLILGGPTERLNDSSQNQQFFYFPPYSIWNSSTIRFGSTVPVMKKFNTWSTSGENGDPITIILNSQGKRAGLGKLDNLVEDINKDGSAIYLTSTQEIVIEDLNSFPLASFGVSINPQTQDVVEVQRPPVSNEFTSAQLQDQNSIG